MNHKLFGFVAFTALAALGAPAAFCDSIVSNQWYAVQWGGPTGTPLYNAPSFTGSLGTVLDNPGTAPWTFTAGTSGAELIVTGLFGHASQFSVFNGTSVLGDTTAPVYDLGTCGNDPLACLNDPLASHGEFFLGPGMSTLSFAMIAAEATAFSHGEAAFEIVTTSPTPEPGAFGLFLLGAAGLLAAKRRLVKR